MKNTNHRQIAPALDSPSGQPVELIASWGDAKLYKDLDGNCRLIGGSLEDQAAAQKWIEVFVTTRLAPLLDFRGAKLLKSSASKNL